MAGIPLHSTANINMMGRRWASMTTKPMAGRTHDGLFIVFEGIDGSGKSSHARHLQQYLAGRLLAGGHAGQVLLTEEPWKQGIGAWVRRQLLAVDEKRNDTMTLLYLLLAARYQHLVEYIMPALAAGQVVISDRFILSTHAYQGYGDGVDIALIKKLSQPIIDMVAVDKTFLLDLAPDAAMARLKHSRTSTDAMEQKPLDFFVKVRDGFLAMAQAEEHKQHNIAVIEASKPEATVRAAIEQMADKLLLAKGIKP